MPGIRTAPSVAIHNWFPGLGSVMVRVCERVACALVERIVKVDRPLDWFFRFSSCDSILKVGEESGTIRNYT